MLMPILTHTLTGTYRHVHTQAYTCSYVQINTYKCNFQIYKQNLETTNDLSGRSAEIILCKRSEFDLIRFCGFTGNLGDRLWLHTDRAVDGNLLWVDFMTVLRQLHCADPSVAAFTDNSVASAPLHVCDL